MKSSENLTGGQPTSPKAPVYPTSPAPTGKGGAGGTPATIETHTDDRDACAVTVCELAKLASQQTPEGTHFLSSDDGNA